MPTKVWFGYNLAAAAAGPGWASVAQDRMKWNWIVRNVTRSDQPSAAMAAAAGGIGLSHHIMI